MGFIVAEYVYFYPDSGFLPCFIYGKTKVHLWIIAIINSNMYTSSTLNCFSTMPLVICLKFKIRSRVYNICILWQFIICIILIWISWSCTLEMKLENIFPLIFKHDHTWGWNDKWFWFICVLATCNWFGGRWIRSKLLL